MDQDAPLLIQMRHRILFILIDGLGDWSTTPPPIDTNDSAQHKNEKEQPPASSAAAAAAASAAASLLLHHPHRRLTLMQQAKIPRMDELASQQIRGDEAKKYGLTGLLDSVESGLACGSDAAHLSLLSYDPLIHYRGRGAFESLGTRGVTLESSHDIAFKCVFATLDEDTNIVVRRRSDRTFTDWGKPLVDALNRLTLPSHPHIRVDVTYANEHRCVVILRDRRMMEEEKKKEKKKKKKQKEKESNDDDDDDDDDKKKSADATASTTTTTTADMMMMMIPPSSSSSTVASPIPRLSDCVSGTDPLIDDRLLRICEPTDSPPSSNAIYTCSVVEEVSRIFREVLRKHPLNIARTEQGLSPANIVLMRGAGVRLDVPRFEDQCLGLGRGVICAPTPLIGGLGLNIGLDRLEPHGATGAYDSDLCAKARTILTAMRPHESKYEFGFLHVKQVDDASHDRDPQRKREWIERVDGMIEFIQDELAAPTTSSSTTSASETTSNEGGLRDTLWSLCVTGDHSSPFAFGDHSCEPVPFVLTTLQLLPEFHPDKFAGYSTEMSQLLSSSQVQSLCDVTTIDDRVETFDEIACADGSLGRFAGREVIPLLQRYKQMIINTTAAATAAAVAVSSSVASVCPPSEPLVGIELNPGPTSSLLQHLSNMLSLSQDVIRHMVELFLTDSDAVAFASSARDIHTALKQYRIKNPVHIWCFISHSSTGSDPTIARDSMQVGRPTYVISTRLESDTQRFSQLPSTVRTIEFVESLFESSYSDSCHPLTASTVFPPSVTKLHNVLFPARPSTLVLPPGLTTLSLSEQTAPFHTFLDVIWPESLTELIGVNGSTNDEGFGNDGNEEEQGEDDEELQEKRKEISSWKLPSTLLSLTFHYMFNTSLVGLRLPPSLTSIKFESHFNKSLVGVILPPHLRRLEFGTWFRHSLEGVDLPATLELCDFADDKHCEDRFPSALRELRIGAETFTPHRPLSDIQLPSQLMKLEILDDVDLALDQLRLPESLTQLKIGISPGSIFDHPFVGVAFPASLTSIVIRGSFNQSLVGVQFPPYLRQLDCTLSNYNQSLCGVELPDTIQDLSLGRSSLHELSRLPASLTRLHIGVLSHSLNTITFPSTLIEMQFDCILTEHLTSIRFPPFLRRFTQSYDTSRFLPLDRLPEVMPHVQKLQLNILVKEHPHWSALQLPPALTHLLIFGATFNQSLAGIKWTKTPPLILSMESPFNQPLLEGYLPPQLTSLNMSHWNLPLTQLHLPPLLTYLHFGCSQSEPLCDLRLPSSIRSLRFQSNSSIDGLVLPPSITNLQWDGPVDSLLAAFPHFPPSLQTISAYPSQRSDATTLHVDHAKMLQAKASVTPPAAPLVGVELNPGPTDQQKHTPLPLSLSCKIGISPWQAEFASFLPSFSPPPSVPFPSSCSVLIIGGGLSGLSGALSLCEISDTRDIMIVDRGLIGSGATGRNGGHMHPHTEEEYQTVQEMLKTLEKYGYHAEDVDYVAKGGFKMVRSITSHTAAAAASSTSSSSVTVPESSMNTVLTAQFKDLHIAPLPIASAASTSSSSSFSSSSSSSSSSTSSSSSSFSSSSFSSLSSPLTGLVYDPRCLLHEANHSHVEQPAARASASMKLLETNGLYARCRHVPARVATDEELLTVHSLLHIEMIDASATTTTTTTTEYGPPESDSVTEGDDDDDDRMYSDCHFLDSAARLSIGGMIDLIELVIQGKLTNGFAIMRPPGHHADAVTSKGFCLYNTVGVAAAHISTKHSSTMKRILIVDFDVHHGDGTQSLFYDNPNVFYFSIHRHEHGALFYPHTGKADEYGGTANALGKNINIPLNYTGLGDTEYIEVFQTILLPIIGEWQPDLILVSAGFDASEGGDPLGGMAVSPECFGYLTALLSASVSHGRIVMALEGGYDINAVSEGISACVKALLGDPLDPLPKNAQQQEAEFLRGESEIEKLQQRTDLFRKDLQDCVEIQQKYWKCLRKSSGEPELTSTASASNSSASSPLDSFPPSLSHSSYVPSSSTTFPAGSIHPVKLLHVYAKILKERYGERVQIWQNTEVRAISSPSSHENGTWHVDTIRGPIQVRAVLHATNAWVSHLAPALKGHVTPVRNHVLQTTPVFLPTVAEVNAASSSSSSSSTAAAPVAAAAPATVSSPPTPELPLFHGLSLGFHHGYDYLIQRPSHSLVFGGGRYLAPRMDVGVEKTEQPLLDYVSEHLRAFLPQAFPRLGGEMIEENETIIPHDRVSVSHLWSGILGFTSSCNPVVGGFLATSVASDASDTSSVSAPQRLLLRGQFVSAGFSGHGMPRCTRAALIVARQIRDYLTRGIFDPIMLPASPTPLIQVPDDSLLEEAGITREQLEEWHGSMAR